MWEKYRGNGIYFSGAKINWDLSVYENDYRLKIDGEVSCFLYYRKLSKTDLAVLHC